MILKKFRSERTLGSGSTIVRYRKIRTSKNAPRCIHSCSSSRARAKITKLCVSSEEQSEVVTLCLGPSHPPSRIACSPARQQRANKTFIVSYDFGNILRDDFYKIRNLFKSLWRNSRCLLVSHKLNFKTVAKDIFFCFTTWFFPSILDLKVL